jgi:hypothetical protein
MTQALESNVVKPLRGALRDKTEALRKMEAVSKRLSKSRMERRRAAAARRTWAHRCGRAPWQNPVDQNGDRGRALERRSR